jgi:hypothetical protein
MRNDTVMIQNPSPANADNGTNYDFFFVLDSCNHLAVMTGRKDCKTEQESQDVLETMYVMTEIQTQFWNSNNFLRNGWEMNSQWVSNEI